MAKLKVDFSQVEDRVFAPVPAGIYNAVVVEATEKVSQSSGNEMVEWVFKITDDIPFDFVDEEGAVQSTTTKNSKQWFYTITQGNIFSLKAFLIAMGHTKKELEANFDFDPQRYLNKPLRLQIAVEDYNGAPKNKVEKTLPPAGGAKMTASANIK